MFTVEQLVAEQKANVQAAYGLAGKSFEGVEQLVELNLAAARASLKESADFTKTALSAKDVQTLLAQQAEALQAMAGKATSYNRQVAEIVQATAGEFAQAAESKVNETQAKLAAVIENLGKNAPAGFETPVNLVKSSVAAANNAYESMQKAVKQATDLAQANVEAVTTQATSVTKTASKKR
ncbi:MAG: hypothetical protein RL758_2489 [Pseudomonadota bacterium]|jgi:phasin family protein